ncbi:MAG TPA: DUF1292 domain-containing protein [Clostridia bacterium]|nr:DUF1292 domain-containing protein [Clostridia bacterium]
MEPVDIKLVDEQGNELNLNIFDVFKLDDKQYAILMSPLDSESPYEVYVLEMKTSNGTTEFVVPDESDLEKVIAEASRILEEQSFFGSECGGSGCEGCGGCGH